MKLMILTLTLLTSLSAHAFEEDGGNYTQIKLSGSQGCASYSQEALARNTLSNVGGGGMGVFARLASDDGSLVVKCVTTPFKKSECIVYTRNR